MNLLRPIPDQIAFQKQKLAELEGTYMVAVNARNYPLTQEIAKRINRIRTALVLHGEMPSGYEADREARQIEDQSTKPWRPE